MYCGVVCLLFDYHPMIYVKCYVLDVLVFLSFGNRWQYGLVLFPQRM
jgi:hypothetical protein